MTKFTTKFLLSAATGVLLSFPLQAQVVTLFSEDMGTPTGTTPIDDHVFENDGLVTYSGSADVRNTGASSGYPEASGGGNVWFSSTGTTDFEISGIDVTLHRSYEVSFGLLKTTNAEDGNNFQVVISVDGIAIAIENPVLPTGSGTSNSYYYLSFALPAGFGGDDMTISFQRLGGTSGFRVDDVLVVGEEIPLSVKLLSFEVFEQNNNHQVVWKTAQEEGVAYFEVEASQDGKNFQVVHQENAANSFTGHTYQVNLEARDHSYYRLKTVNTNNSVEYSNVVRLYRDYQEAVQVRNTLIRNSMIVENASANLPYRVINMAGQVVLEGNLESGYNVLDMNSLQAGNYVFTTPSSQVKISKL